jgi:hypothetical protein
MNTFRGHTVDPALFDGPVPLSGGETKPLRAIALAEPGDVVWVPESTLALARSMLTYYEEMGIVRDVLLTSEWPRALSRGQQLDVLFFGTAAHALAPNEYRLRASLRWNSKNNFLRDAKELGGNVPYTKFIDKGSFRVPGFVKNLPIYLRTEGATVVLKAAVSAGGKDVLICRTAMELMRAIESDQFFGRDVQVQEYLSDATFYGVQYARGRIFVTEQVMNSHGAYAGAIPVCNRELVEAMHTTTRRVISAVAGEEIPIFSLDVAVAADGRILLLECNPRYGGTSFPWLLAERIGLSASQWEYRYIPCRQGIDPFRTCLTTAKLPGQMVGAIVVDPGVDHGEVGVMFVGNESARRSLIRACTQLLA